jgi:hypothetical protein
MFRTAQENDIPPRFPLLADSRCIFASGLSLVLLRLITFFTQERAVEQGFAQILGSIPVGLLLIAIGGGISFYLNRWQHDVAAKSPYAILPSFTRNSHQFHLHH